MRKALAALALIASPLALATDLGGDGLGGPSLQPRAQSAQLGEPGIANREISQVDPVLIEAGEPALDFRFAKNKSLIESTTNKSSLITFSRSAAQSPGTYVGSDGLIHDAAVNLALYSEQFDNAYWTKSGTTIEANQAISPDGKQTADRLTPSASNALHYIWRGADISSANISNYSVYVKADGYSKIALRESKSYGSYASFDLSTGTVLDAAPASIGKLEGYGIENVGDGWYRIYANFGDITLHRWGLWALPESYTSGQPASSWLANGTDGYLIWGAQLEETDPATMAPTAYIHTTSQALAAPRFDHVPTSGNVTTNLLTYSEMLDVSSKWTTYNSTVTANATADPDGGTNADRVTLTNGNLRQKVTSDLSGQTYTYSFYAKTVSGNLNLPIHFSEANTPYAVIGSDTVSLTNDWQKFAVTVTLSSTSQTQMNVWFGSSVGAGSTGDFYVYQAQLEKAPTPGPYVRTLSETRSISDANAESLGLLVEEARANLLTYSEQFNIGWTPNNLLYTGDAEVAPDGTMTADKLIPNTTFNAAHFATQTISANGTFTVYAKAGEYDKIMLWNPGANRGRGFDLTNGTTFNTGLSDAPSYSITDVGNGWYRCAIYNTGITSAQIYVLTTTAYTAYAGNGSDGVYLWGAQLESATFPTSYIPTVTSQTRYADVAAVQDEDFATTNLLAYSESFDVGWSTIYAIVTADAVSSPDGQNTADEITAGATSSYNYVGIPTSISTGSVRTESVYVKKNTANFLALNFGGGTTDAAWFDLTNGVVGTVNGGGSASIMPVGDGWFKVTHTKPSGGAHVFLNPADADGSFYTTAGKSLYLWGASLTATEYPVEYVTTRNLLTDSQDFERGSWSKVRLRPIVDDTAVAPDGTLSADYIEQIAGNNTAGVIYKVISASQNTFSIYAKAKEKNWIRLLSGTHLAYFDLQNGVVGTVSSGANGSMQDVGNGWWRINMTSPSATTANIYLADSDNSATVNDSGGIYIWGAQLEPGTTPTEYVRTVDVVGKSYGWYEPTEGTVFVEAQTDIPDYGLDAFLYKLDGTSNDFQYFRNSFGTPGALIQSRGYSTDVVLASNNVDPDDPFKNAIGMKYNDFFMSGDNQTAFDTTGTLTEGAFALEVGKQGANYFNGHIKRLTYWPRRQSDSTLQVITQ